MNGGYVMIKSSDSEIYSKVKKAIEIGKPILFYENDTTCYYIDSASIVSTDVVLTKGGKTITIDSSNNVVSSGDIQNHLYANNIRLDCIDSSTNSVYLTMQIISKEKLETLDSVKNYIKNNTDYGDSKTLLINGYNSDSNVTFSYIGYLSNDNSFKLCGNDDNEETITIDSVTANIIQLF